MIELLGAVLGGVFRLAPEVIKGKEKKAEMAHELAMSQQALEFEKVRGAQKMEELAAQQSLVTAEGDAKAFLAAIQGQSQQTGIKWVDAINSLVRPVMAFQWVLLLWPAVVVAGFVLAIQHGTDPLVALQGAFGEEERALALGIANFFLVNRIYAKK